MEFASVKKVVHFLRFYTQGAAVFEEQGATDILGSQANGSAGADSSSRPMPGRVSLHLIIGFLLGFLHYATSIDDALSSSEHYAIHYNLGWDYRNAWANQASKYMYPAFFKATQKVALEQLSAHQEDLAWILDYAAAQNLISI